MWDNSGQTPAQRSNEALRLLDIIDDGAIERPKDIDFMQRIRERVERFGANTTVNPQELFWLRDIKDRQI